MKLRVKDDSVRLRLTQSEVAALAKGEPVAGQTRLGAMVLVYGVRPGQTASLVVDGLTIWAEAPMASIQAWASSDDEGMRWNVPNGVGETAVHVEKDFACLKPRGAEDADTFPHPNAGTTQC